jgi:hypothetical protein
VSRGLFANVKGGEQKVGPSTNGLKARDSCICYILYMPALALTFSLQARGASRDGWAGPGCWTCLRTCAQAPGGGGATCVETGGARATGAGLKARDGGGGVCGPGACDGCVSPGGWSACGARARHKGGACARRGGAMHARRQGGAHTWRRRRIN